MDLPGLGLNLTLPTPDVKVDKAKVGHFLVDALFGGSTFEQAARQLVHSHLYAAVDEALGVKQRMLEHLRESTDADRAKFEDTLSTLRYGLINIQGDPETGKTTCAADLAARFFEPNGRRIYCIGVPQDVLPRGWRELAPGELSIIGSQLNKAGENQAKALNAFQAGSISRAEYDKQIELTDPKTILAKFVPADSVVIVDDAGIYLSSGRPKPINVAIRNLIDIRRHLGLIVINTFQSFYGVDVKFSSAADITLFKQSDDRIKAADRAQIMQQRGEGLAYFADYRARKSDEGWDDEAIREAVMMMAWVYCPGGYTGPWRHRRPKWYGERFSRNANPDIVDIEEGDYTVLDDESPQTTA